VCDPRMSPQMDGQGAESAHFALALALALAVALALAGALAGGTGVDIPPADSLRVDGGPVVTAAPW
jgi:hypothetical protein